MNMEKTCKNGGYHEWKCVDFYGYKHGDTLGTKKISRCKDCGMERTLTFGEYGAPKAEEYVMRTGEEK